MQAKARLPLLPYSKFVFITLLTIIFGIGAVVVKISWRHDLLVPPTDMANNVHDLHKNEVAFVNVPKDLLETPSYITNLTQVMWDKNAPKKFMKWSLDSNKGCPLCGPRYHNPSANSSPRDLVITLMLNMTMNAGTFVRTLRSTGCQATIVVFVDVNFTRAANSHLIKMFKDCGVNLINIGNINPLYQRKIFEVRHVLVYDFLKKYRQDFDRIIFVDMADTFFQIDPFTTDFTSSTMGITSELYTLNNDPANNTKWIKVADPNYADDPAFYNDKVALNAGFIFGSMNGFMIFYDVFLRLPCYRKKFAPKTIDQGYVNFLYYRGFFERAGLKLSVTHPGDYLLSVRGGQFEASPNRNGLFVMRGTSVVPAAIHQYNRICPLIAGLKRQCHRMWYDKQAFPYVKDASQNCSTKGIDSIRDTVNIDRVKAITQLLHSKLPISTDGKEAYQKHYAN